MLSAAYGAAFWSVCYPMHSYWVWPTQGRTQCAVESRMGRIDEMWMTCRASLTAAVLDVRRMGMRCGRAPQIAILVMRLSLTHITHFRQSFAFSCSCFYLSSYSLKPRPRARSRHPNRRRRPGMPCCGTEDEGYGRSTKSATASASISGAVSMATCCWPDRTVTLLFGNNSARSRIWTLT